MSQDPAVITWQIALAGSRRPSPGPRRHWWRELVTGHYRDARDAWEVLRERCEDRGGAMRMEADEFRAAYPAPTLKAFMVGLSSGSMAPPEPLPAPDAREVA